MPSTDSGHAFLHDFCVTIPYGCAVGVLAVVAYLQQAGSIATTLLAASVSALSLTYLSLQNWRARKPCKPYTLLTAGEAAPAVGLQLLSPADACSQGQAHACRCSQAPRAQRAHADVAASAAAVAAAAAYFSWQQGSAVSAWLRLPSTLASAAVGLFLLYNVLAGGNPPPGEKPLADAAPHSINN